MGAMLWVQYDGCSESNGSQVDIELRMGAGGVSGRLIDSLSCYMHNELGVGKYAARDWIRRISGRSMQLLK